MLSHAQQIIGIEINSYFSDLQTKLISKYGLSSRVRIVNDDICNQPELIQCADVVVLNNVFEFFCTLEEQARLVCRQLLFYVYRYTNIFMYVYIDSKYVNKE